MIADYQCHRSGNMGFPGRTSANARGGGYGHGSNPFPPGVTCLGYLCRHILSNWVGRVDEQWVQDWTVFFTGPGGVRQSLQGAQCPMAEINVVLMLAYTALI